MRQLRYSVAASLDGCIAGPNGEFDWMLVEMPVYVYSRSLPEGERDGATFRRDAVAHVRSLKQTGGDKPLWLWGGGELFRELAAAGLVDGVDVAIIPIVLGGGIPLMPAPGPRLPLTLRTQRLYPKTGTLFVEYDLAR